MADKMNFGDTKPVVRTMEPVSIEHEGQKLVVVHDPQRLTETSLTLSMSAYWIVCHMNGVNSINRIMESYKKTFNVDIEISEVEKLVAALDKSLFMDNENFRSYKRAVIKEFNDSPVRRSTLAGKSYPEDAEELSKMLDGFLDGKQLNGAAPAAPFAVIAPHIDLSAGGDAFGAAYATLKNSRAETFVILGIGHKLDGDFFACIDKPFETPLGKTAADTDFLKKLESDFGEPIYNEDFAHKNEHSIEFQILFLQKLFGKDTGSKKIVPILLSFPENIDEIDHPVFNLRRVEKFSNALKKGVDAMGGKVALIAGIDLAHVGERFGQEDGAGPERLEALKQDDRKLLDLVADGNKEEFVTYMKAINPENHVCGFPALWMLFDLIGGRKGSLLEYRQSVEGNNDSVVTFAAMAFDDKADAE
jgi:hypothetical protein